MRQFAMAQAMAKLEPKAPISVAAGGTLIDPRTFKPVFTAKAAAQRGVAVGEGQELRDPITGELLATGPAKTQKAETKAPVWKEVVRGGKIYYEDFNNPDAAARQAGAIEKEAAPSKKVRVELTAADGSIKTVLMDESDTRLAEGLATKGPDYVSITEVNPKGETVVRQVKKDDAILATGYVKPLDGFLGQLQAAGVPVGNWKSDPKLADLVNRYFVKTAGGVAPEDVAGFDLRKAEVVARLGELGIAVPANIKGLGLSVTPGVLGGAQSTSAAPATGAALAMPSNKNQLVNGQTYQTRNGPAKWDAAIGQFVQ
jgi:hypothetical protein